MKKVLLMEVGDHLSVALPQLPHNVDTFAKVRNSHDGKNVVARYRMTVLVQGHCERTAQCFDLIAILQAAANDDYWKEIA